MHCEEHFLEAIEDYQRGGHNDWYIEDFTKYSKGGFMLKAKRRLKTRDNFDYVLLQEPDKILYALHDKEYELTKPIKTGIRSLSKFYKYQS